MVATRTTCIYCNRSSTRLLNKVPTDARAGRARELLNEAEAKYISADIPSIPVYARPQFIIYNTSVKGPVLNPTLEGSTWNVEQLDGRLAGRHPAALAVSPPGIMQFP